MTMGRGLPGVDNPNVLAIRCECGLDSPITLIRKGLTACPRCGKEFHLPKTPRHISQDIIFAAVIYGGLSLLAIMTVILLFALL